MEWKRKRYIVDKGIKWVIHHNQIYWQGTAKADISYHMYIYIVYLDDGLGSKNSSWWLINKKRVGCPNNVAANHFDFGWLFILAWYILSFISQGPINHKKHIFPFLIFPKKCDPGISLAGMKLSGTYFRKCKEKYWKGSFEQEENSLLWFARG